MVLNLPIRLPRPWLMMILALSVMGYAHASTVLTIDEELRSGQSQGGVPPQQHSPPPAAHDPAILLSLSRELNPLTGDKLPVTAVNPPAYPSAMHAVAVWILKTVYGLSSILLLLHILREWCGLLQIRVRRPERSIPLPFAPWPSVSVLLPLHDKPAAQQERFLDSLAHTAFGYPRDKIHFVPMFDPAIGAVVRAVRSLETAFPRQVHPLPILADQKASLASELYAAGARSVGVALVVCDQFPHIPEHWLRESVTPLLDPAVGAVLTKYVPLRQPDTLTSRLAQLADHSLALASTQRNALSLLLAGKARIRALRRQAVKDQDVPRLLSAPDGAEIILALTGRGWQSHLLSRALVLTEENNAQDLIDAPRMQPSIVMACMRAVWTTLWPGIPSGCRLQARSALFSAVLPLLWMFLFLSSCAMFFCGWPLAAAAGMALCAVTCFDPFGHPNPALVIAASARMAGLRTEIRLLPLAVLYFLDRLLAGLETLLKEFLQTRNSARASSQPVRQAVVREGETS